MNKLEFIKIIDNREYARAETMLQNKILQGQFDVSDLKYLGIVLEKQGKNKEALTYLKIAERVSIADPEIEEVIAFVFDKIGDFKNAVDYFEKIIKRKNKDWRLATKIGDCFYNLSNYTSAIKYYIDARNLKKDSIEPYFGLYKSMLKLEKYKECLFVLEEAIKIKNDSAVLYLNAGLAAAQSHDYIKSLKYLRKSLRIEKTPGAYLNLGNLYKQMALIEKSIATTSKCIDLVPDYLIAYQNLCIDYNYYWEAKRKTFSVAKKYGEIVESRAQPYKAWKVDFFSDKKLRVGFVSGDFRLHPVSHFLIDILDAIPRENLTLVGYYNGEIADSMTRRICKKFDEWNIGMNFLSDRAFAEKIQKDRIDILVDLSGHTAKTRTAMFAYKPSPVQVNWLGYFNTTGLKAIDWIIADKNVLPAKDKRYFTERPYYMPDIYYAYSKPTVDTNTLESPYLKNGYITFGCFNNYPKLNEKVLDSWVKILTALPEAKLILKNRQLENQNLSKSLLKKFSKRGIEVSRITLESSSPMKEYYDSFNKIDIALDPFPFPGGTTTIDGLWMGVPVVTLSGNTFVSRQGDTILKNIGMEDWISYSEDEYVNLAIKKAKSLPKILKSNRLYKQKLREQVENSTVMNTKLFSSHLADAFRSMWIDYLQNNKP